MIEITHKQAQHLIREGLDRRLPDAQWAMLQSHLENCPECSAYRERLITSQRGLTHALRLRWSSARGPRPGTTKYLLDLREKREKRHRWLVRFSRYGLVLVLLLAYWGYRRITAPPPLPTPAPPPTVVSGGQPGAPQPTPTPVITFRGLVAFEEHQEGSSEIVLLNISGGQVDRSNLTQNPAAETHPAWSPDGEWIAFLSDRSGKNEIYLITVAGSRLTQITSSPDIEWQGPLEWSYDGQYIALTGQRADSAGDPYLYLVPTDGDPPRAIAYTRGALPWAHFSPTMPILAYPSTEPSGGISAVNVQTGWTANVTMEDTRYLRMRLPHPEGFDWSLGGTSLIYPAAGSATDPDHPTYLRLSPELSTDSTNFTGSGAQTIATGDAAETFRAVTSVPNSLLVASLENQDGSGCWTLRLDHAYNRLVAPRRLPGLCVEGSLERSSWTGDGNWLVLLARRPEEAAPAIYAVRLPAGDDGQPLYERLGDVNLLPASGGLPLGPALRVRRIGRQLRLNPRATQAQPEGVPTGVPPSLPPADASAGWIYYTVDLGETSQIFRARPDGTQAEPLTGDSALLKCPRVSPDGRVAYLSDMGRPSASANMLFVMDGDGQNQIPLNPAGNRSYACPVWSPDGSKIAAFSYQDGQPALAVLPADGSEAPPLFLPVELTGLSAPVWVPNNPADPAQGTDKLLVLVPRGRNPARLLEYDLSLPESQRETPRELAMFTGWDDVWGLTLSPDGQRLAMVMIFYNRTARLIGPATAQLRVYEQAWNDFRATVQLNSFDPDTVGQGGLAWLTNNRIGLVRSTSLIGVDKSVFEILGMVAESGNIRLTRAAEFQDVIFNAAWGGSGAAGPKNWVIFSAESGLWALDLSPVIDNTGEAVIPAQINPAVIQDVVWR